MILVNWDALVKSFWNYGDGNAYVTFWLHFNCFWLGIGSQIIISSKYLVVLVDYYWCEIGGVSNLRRIVAECNGMKFEKIWQGFSYIDNLKLYVSRHWNHNWYIGTFKRYISHWKLWAIFTLPHFLEDSIHRTFLNHNFDN